MCDVKVRCSRVLTVKIFDHQIVTNLPQNTTQIIILLKTYEIWVFLNETMDFSKKFKIRKGSKFAVECVSDYHMILHYYFIL